MTLTLPHPRLLAVALAAFALTFAALMVAREAPDSTPASRAIAAAAVPLPAPGAPAADRVRSLRRQVAADPSADGFAGLAGAHLQAARETADAAEYTRAGDAVRRALALEPDNASALVEASALAASRHRFPDALVYARRARAAAPDLARPYVVLADALVELGRLSAAARALQHALDLQPSSGAYARASYLRELRGDLPGALQAMRLAVSAGAGAAENAASLETLLGDLELRTGRLAAARRSYRTALARFAGLPKAELGLARADAAQGRLGAAVTRLRALVDRLPTPEHAIALGEAELVAGHGAAAREAFALVEIQRTLLARAGLRTDAELAIFEADHGSASRAVAMARRAVAAHEGLRAPDALAWALTRAGRSHAALPWARRAVSLAVADPLTAYHAGVAAARAGQRELAARRLRVAVGGAAALGPLHAAAARRELERVR